MALVKHKSAVSRTPWGTPTLETQGLRDQSETFFTHGTSFALVSSETVFRPNTLDEAMTAPASTPQSSPNSWVPRGTLVGSRYRLDGVIAGGGMGVVYRALDTASGRPVALKMLRRDHANNPNAKRRFLQEARLLGNLRGAYVPRLLDVGEHEGGLYFTVLELLAGCDLRRLLNQRNLEAGEAVDITLQLCAALAEAHDQAVVHRDVKPENIVLASESGIAVKLVDFGIAKDTTSSQTYWVSGKHTLGSPEYMAPEQFDAPDSVDGRADVWSLGAVLYEMLCGNPPPRFRAADGRPSGVLIPELPPHVSEELEAVVTRALAEAPNDRYEDVRQFAEALAPFAGELGHALVEAWFGRVVQRQPQRARTIKRQVARSGVFAAPVIKDFSPTIADGSATLDVCSTRSDSLAS